MTTVGVQYVAIRSDGVASVVTWEKHLGYAPRAIGLAARRGERIERVERHEGDGWSPPVLADADPPRLGRCKVQKLQACDLRTWQAAAANPGHDAAELSALTGDRPTVVRGCLLALASQGVVVTAGGLAFPVSGHVPPEVEPRKERQERRRATERTIEAARNRPPAGPFDIFR